MKLRKDSGPSPVVQQIIAAAQKHLGYTSDLLGKNQFGQKVGYDSQPWGGAFVDVCLREAGVHGPAFTYTPSALAEYFRGGQIYRDPLPGDIVIYNYSSPVGHAADAFSMPHCGVVTDVREFTSTGRFITIEGNTVGSTVHQQKDGVYQKVRHVSEVLAFCRPQRITRPNFIAKLLRILDRSRTKFDGQDLQAIDEASRQPTVIEARKEVRPGDRNKRIEVIQLALATVTDLRGAEPGKWDPATAAACSRYQRMIGYVGKDVSGLPDVHTLQRLARETGLFRLDA